jgi:hypothetical protein
MGYQPDSAPCRPLTSKFRIAERHPISVFQKIPRVLSLIRLHPFDTSNEGGRSTDRIAMTWQRRILKETKLSREHCPLCPN